MARTTVKSTYSLDVETVRALERLARRWNVSKSEAMRRAIRSADERRSEPNPRLEALRALQASLNLTEEQADAWVRDIREERRASSERVDRRRRS